MRHCLPAPLAAFLFGCSADPPPPVREDSYGSAGELRVATRLDALWYRVDEAGGRASGYEHDLLVALAARLGVPVRFQVYADALHALEMVAKGALDLAGTDRAQYALAANFFPNLGVALALPIKSGIAWAMPAGGTADLPRQVEDLLAEAAVTGTLARVGDRYFGHVRRLEQSDVAAFLSRIRERLSRFRRHFQYAQALTGIDWRLLDAD